MDPLPLREDTEISIPKFTEATLPVSAVPESPANNPGQPSSLPHAPSYWHPSRRIQGSLRHPEFQHNGNYFSFNFLSVEMTDRLK